MSTVVEIKDFDGLDARRLATSAPLTTFRELRNLQVTAGKSLRTRPGTRKFARLAPESKGLFTVDGSLRTVAPAGYADIQNTIGLPVRYVLIGNGGLLPRDYITELANVEQYGNEGEGQAIPYMVIKASNGRYEHHYADVAPTSAVGTVDTLVDVPFEPSGGLVNLSGRLFAPSDLTGAVHFNSIVNGARDWTESEDAGFLPVARNAPGDNTIQGLSHYRQRLVVAFEDSIQIWGVDENPDNVSLVRSAQDNLNGPGTLYPKALVNVLGDTFYLSRGGVRSLQTTIVEGERQEDQGVGVRVDPVILKALENATHVSAKWSQVRGQWLLAIDTQIYSLTYIPRAPGGGSVVAWGCWDMPFTITDMAESKGKLYARDTDNFVHEFSDDLYTDDGEPITYYAKTPRVGKGAKSYLWDFEDIRFAAEGTFNVWAFPDPNDDDCKELLGVQDNTSSPFDHMATPYTSSAVAFAFEGTGRFQLDEYALSLMKLE